jgi:methyltransferase
VRTMKLPDAPLAASVSAYLALVGAVAALRLAELVHARRNLRRLLARGGVEAAPGHYPAMVVLHAAFLVACPLEVVGLGRPFIPALAAPMALLLGLAMALRYWAISTLGERWATRIVCLPGVPPVESGPYRWLRHPNYLAVAVEIAALPLVHTAWWSALFFTAANAWLLAVRIAAEEKALAGCSGYAAALADRPRLLPARR